MIDTLQDVPLAQAYRLLNHGPTVLVSSAHAGQQNVMAGLLTVYDMLKAVDRGMEIAGVRLLEKQGGKSGHWHAGDNDHLGT